MSLIRVLTSSLYMPRAARAISGLGLGDRDTIFALSTPHGKSAISIIRISGREAVPTLYALTDSTKRIKPRRVTLRKVFDPISCLPIDRALVMWFPQGASFTGEDTVELHLHGSPAIVRATLRSLRTLGGLRPAQPGEFTQRALQNGRMSLLEVEALGDLVNAETEMQRRAAFNQLEGRLARTYDQWTDKLLGAVASMEAHIDFSETETLGGSLAEESLGTADEVLKSVTQFLQDSQLRERINTGLSVAIIGPPNVGKSSLLNLLSQREVAITSPTPGTTRDIVECRLEVGGVPVSVCDTAGLRATSDVIECEGIRRAVARARSADVVVVVLDAREVTSGLEVAERLDLIGRHINCDINEIIKLSGISLILVNKCDLLGNRPELRNAQFISCKTNEGVSEFLEFLSLKVASLVECGVDEDDLIVVGERHKFHLSEVSQSLKRAVASDNIPISAEYLRHSLFHLGHITGRVGVEDVLDRIFSKFCIGK